MDQQAIIPLTIQGFQFNMIKIEGGTFWMGSQSDNPDGMNYDKEASPDEAPVHQATVGSFYLGETEVSQELWTAVMGNNPSCYKDPQCDLPVDNVSWNDCQLFIEKLNTLTNKTFRLPTEAEWEYAAGGGLSERRFRYSGSNFLNIVAWQTDSDGFRSHPLKAKKPNKLGLYDMTGNLWEWCDDWYGSYDPSIPQTSNRKVLRGGGWMNEARFFRNSYRELELPDCRNRCIGLRLATDII